MRVARIGSSAAAAILLRLALGSTLVFTIPSSQSFSFALMGDAPYSEDEATWPLLPGMMRWWWYPSFLFVFPFA